MSFFKWSKVASSNSTADTSTPWPEGMSPSAVNDSSRGLMAAAAKFRDDISGSITTGGTSTAYTVTSNQTFGSLSDLAGQMIAFVPHATNGATVTLSVDGLTAKPLRAQPSVELPAGALILGTPYIAVYNSSDAVFYLHGVPGAAMVPLGTMLPYAGGTSAPSTNFALPYGQAISRITYASLFAIMGTTFGTGDGSSTFNLPDARGRAIFGLDNMGGSAASRITNSGSGVVGTTLGATGGAETVTMAQANLPNVTLSGTTANGGVDHTHGPPSGMSQFIGTAGTVSSAYGSSGVSINYGNTTGGASAYLHTHTFTTSSMNGNTTQTAMNNLPPAIILPFIIRVL